MPRLQGFVLLGLFVGPACSGGASPGSGLPQGPVAGATTWQLIPPDGGTITTADDVTITVPAGAVTEPTFIEVARYASSSLLPAVVDVPKGGGVAEYRIRVVGNGYELGPVGSTFAQPVTVTIPFDPPSAGSSSANVVVVAYAAPGGPLPSTLVDETHVSAQTTKSSTMFPAVITGFSMTCATTADCASGQTCDHGTNLCAGD